MKIIALAIDSKVYSSNAYLVLGSWNCLDDINTLVDTGNDPGILEQFAAINTGVGKRPVEQIVLTHCHFDHKGILGKLITRFNPVVCACGSFDGVNRRVKDGSLLRMGDRYFDIIHSPGHSHDSLCFHCAEEGVLFSGDTPLQIMPPGGTDIPDYVAALIRLSRLRITAIYTGHGKAITERASETLQETLRNVRNSGVERQPPAPGIT